MTKEEQEQQKASKTDQSRRDFLRKSKYAAYAAPLMTSLVINQAAAADSPCVALGDGECSGT